jgi:hypothetical protein
MMKVVWLIGIGASTLYLPCSKGDGAAADDGGGEAAAPVAVVVDAAPPAAVEPVPKNAAKVGRFANETKLGLEKEKLLADHTIARESPAGGPLILVLRKDTEVTKISSRGDYFLIAFADPKDPTGAPFFGWINRSGFAPTPPLPKGVCAKGQVKFEGLGCRVDCSADGTCPAGMTCTGLGARPEINEGAFRFCEGSAAGKDGGAPAAKDGGK